MPTKLREFYWNELLDAKNTEAKVYEKGMKQPSNSKVSRRK
jgi:hypothetical protein